MNAQEATPELARHEQTLLTELRWSVALLGEARTPPWWPSQFLLDQSRSFLQPVFSRSTMLAQLRGATEAARKVHDSGVGKSSYHLFRLPLSVEAQMAQLIKSGAVRTAESEAEAKALLWSLAEGKQTKGVGAISMGSINTLHAETSLAQLASLYLHGVEEGQLVLPFYTAL